MKLLTFFLNFGLLWTAIAADSLNQRAPIFVVTPFLHEKDRKAEKLGSTTIQIGRPASTFSIQKHETLPDGTIVQLGYRFDLQLREEAQGIFYSGSITIKDVSNTDKNESGELKVIHTKEYFFQGTVDSNKGARFKLSNDSELRLDFNPEE